MKSFVVLLGVALTVSGCSKVAGSQPQAAKGAAQGATPATPEVKALPAQLPDVLARVNGDPVKKPEFERAVRSLEQRVGRSVPVEQRDQVYREVLDQLVGFRLMAQEAKARSIAVPDADINQRIDGLKAQFKKPEEFEQALASQQMTLADLKEQTTNELRVAKLVEAEINAKVNVQPADLDDYYKKNPEQFKKPVRVRASHILIGVEQNADAAAKQAARTKAEGVLKEVKAGGDFGALAKKYSVDTGSAKNGGDLGYFAPGQMVPPFEKTAFSLKPGEVSELVETQFGFHIIKVSDREAEAMLTMEEVTPRLKDYITQRKRFERTNEFIGELKKKAKLDLLV